MDANRLSARAAAQAVAARQLSSVELLTACLKRIEAREPSVKAWTYCNPDKALAAARACDAGSPRGPLHGVPIGVKDIIDTADMPTEYGSPIYAGHRPVWDAACVALIKRAGGIVLGKTVTTEFAARHPGKTANPHNPAHTPGGSSSGSAAAVADFMVPIGFATQTAGSIIRPAAYCGAVGVKPSFGTYAMAGIKPYAASLDTLGTITRHVDDALLMWEVLQGVPAPEGSPLPARPRVGLCQTPFWSAAEPAAAEALQAAGRKLAAADCDLDMVELPSWFETLNKMHRQVQSYEGARSFAHELATPRRELVSTSLREMADSGWRISPGDYVAARAAIVRARAEFASLMDRFDILMAPATPGEAPASLGTTGDPVFNSLWTFLHVPSVSLPVMKGPQGLPVGVQFIGRFDGDLQLLRLVRRIEESFA
jgi:amidase